MLHAELIAAAVFNNVVWCNSVCLAFGCDTEFADGLWVNRDPGPPLYPNVVTVTRSGMEMQLARIRSIARTGRVAGWAVKDSFRTLDLVNLGFDVLFEADWLTLPADQPVPAPDLPDVQWDRVVSDHELAAWEAAWRGAPANASAIGSDVPRVFMPSMLDDPDVAFLAAHRQDRIIAVVAANRSDDGSGSVVGLSNHVSPAADGPGFAASAVAAVRSVFPGLPVVGYEAGRDRVVLLNLGFEPLAQLRIWVAA